MGFVTYLILPEDDHLWFVHKKEKGLLDDGLHRQGRRDTPCRRGTAVADVVRTACSVTVRGIVREGGPNADTDHGIAGNLGDAGSFVRKICFEFVY